MNLFVKEEKNNEINLREKKRNPAKFQLLFTDRVRILCDAELKS